MRKLWLGTMLLAVVVGLVFTHFETLKLQAAWPIVVGVALAPLGARGRGHIRTSISVIVGVAVSAGVFFAVSYWMPFIPMSFGIWVGIAVGLMGSVAILAPKWFSLPASLVGFGVFYGLYEAQWISDRAAIRGEAASAAASTIVLMLGGLAISFAVSSLLALQARQRAGEVIPFRARLRVAEPEMERRAAAGGGM